MNKSQCRANNSGRENFYREIVRKVGTGAFVDVKNADTIIARLWLARKGRSLTFQTGSDDFDRFADIIENIGGETLFVEVTRSRYSNDQRKLVPGNSVGYVVSENPEDGFIYDEASECDAKTIQRMNRAAIEPETASPYVVSQNQQVLSTFLSRVWSEMKPHEGFMVFSHTGFALEFLGEISESGQRSPADCHVTQLALISLRGCRVLVGPVEWERDSVTGHIINNYRIWHIRRDEDGAIVIEEESRKSADEFLWRTDMLHLHGIAL